MITSAAANFESVAASGLHDLDKEPEGDSRAFLGLVANREVCVRPFCGVYHEAPPRRCFR